MHGTTINISQ